MGKTRQDFTPEYRDEAVKLAINEATLGRWVNQGRGKVLFAVS